MAEAPRVAKVEEEKPRRWLACFDPHSGMAQLCNVGVVEAVSRAEAIEKAGELFRTSTGRHLMVYLLDQLTDGWAYWR